MRSKLNRLVTVSVFFMLGLVIAASGFQKDAVASELDLFLGKKKSTTTVYFVSDWFCPACIKVEPVIEQMYPAIAKRARISFVDFPIHRETTNFTPYNLQFLAFEKAKYIKLRHALSEVARKTRRPTDADVQQAVAHLGVRLRQMDNSQVLYGMQANLMVYRGYDVNATPSVVVTNARTKKSKTLVGDRQITEQGVKEAIAEVEKR